MDVYLALDESKRDRQCSFMIPAYHYLNSATGGFAGFNRTLQLTPLNSIYAQWMGRVVTVGSDIIEQILLIGFSQWCGLRTDQKAI